ncbi:MAG: tetratricopeptide repeat protein [Verrucomicrobia bacterium]|nr:tetratricopeptide repeat protein [Verrucomicrobiota bacterium]
MSDLLTGAVAVLLATNQPAALSNFVERTTGIAVPVANPDDPVERAYLKLVEADNAAQTEVENWMREDEKFAEANGGVRSPTLRSRILQRFEPVRKGYDEFLLQHPEHVAARVAYASFLGDIKEEAESFKQLEKAAQLAPNDPAILNNLANIHGHIGDVRKAFDLYERAIALKPKEALYYHNFGDTVYLFRRDAMEHYKIDVQQVFDKALKLYAQALELDPKNFPLATDAAKTYYGIEPKRIEDALAAWRYAFKLAEGDEGQQGVRLHFARWEMFAKRFDQARTQLNQVTLPQYSEIRSNVWRMVEKREAEAKTNAVPVKP